MSINVINCSNCGKLCHKNIKLICSLCLREVEEKYNLCINYLRKNKESTLHELSEITGVSYKLIYQFIREGRISMGEFKNLTVSCEVCGIQVRDVKICDNCRKRFVNDMKNMQEDARKISNNKQENKTSYEIKEKD